MNTPAPADLAHVSQLGFCAAGEYLRDGIQISAPPFARHADALGVELGAVHVERYHDPLEVAALRCKRTGCKRTGERSKGHSRTRTQTTCKHTRGLASQQIAAVERACFVRAPTRARARWTTRGSAFGAAALAPALFGHVCKKMAAEEHSVGVAGGVDLGHCVRTRKLQQSPPVSAPPATPTTAEGLT